MKKIKFKYYKPEGMVVENVETKESPKTVFDKKHLAKIMEDPKFRREFRKEMTRFMTRFMKREINNNK